MLSQEFSRWLTKVSRVLVLTMLCSTFMYQGWYKPQPADAAITYQTPGAISYSAAAGTTVAPAYPAAIAANDLLVMIVGMKPGLANSGSVATPAGWTPIVSLIGAGGYGSTLGTDTGNTNLFAYYKVAAGTETGSLTVTLAANNISWAQIYRLSKALAVWDVAGATGSDVTGDAAVSIAFGSNPGVAANDFILGAMCTPTDIGAGTQFSAEAFTQTGATFGAASEISEPLSALGNQISGFVARASVNTGTGSAAPTMTAAAGGTLTNVRGPGIFIRIREATTPSTITSCADCHGYTTVFTDGTSRNMPTGAFVGDHNTHVIKVKTPCTTCHVTPATFGHRTGSIQMNAGVTAISSGYYDKNGNAAYNAVTDETWSQTNAVTTSFCRNISCHGGNNPTPQWGVGTAGCISCHSGIVTAANASIVSSGIVTNRAAVTTEFSLAWGHKKTGRGAVTDADCIVCHLEGDYTTQKTSVYHADGYINLRDPDAVAAETSITDMSSATFSFVQFSTSYAAGARTSTGNTLNTVDNVLTQKFCLACHDADGAANTTARVGANTAFMPWGGSTGYTTVQGAAAANGLIDVKTQFATANSSAHPVLGPRNKDFPTAPRFNDPYKPAGTRGTSGTFSQGVVINCFDCHNAPTPLTSRTVAAHGSNATDYLRGTATVSGTPAAGTNEATFCKACHAGYDTSAVTSHDAGSAFDGTTRAGMTVYLNYGCNYCHSSSETAVRPWRAEDIHGNNRLRVSAGTDLMWPVGTTETNRPYAFIRNASTTVTGSVAGTVNLTIQRPLKAGSELTSGSPSCQTTGSGPCSNMSSLRNYLPGGSY